MVPLSDPWVVPYAPPRPPHPRRRQLVVLSVAIALLLLAGFGTVVTHVVRDEIRAEQALERDGKAADAAFDRRLEEPADTETVSPRPDGSRTFAVPAPDSGRHAYRLRLPRGWEGRRMGIRESPYSYSDAVLTAPDLGAAITIDRVEIGVRTGSPEMGQALRAAMGKGADAVEFSGPMVETTIGRGEPAYALDGTMENDGDPRRLRIVVFDHGSEDTFRVDVLGSAAAWGSIAPEVDRILRSWRWG